MKAVETLKVQAIEIDRLVKIFNPRRPENETATPALLESIRREGLLVPLVVAPLPDGKFEILRGHCRYSALVYLHKEDPSRWGKIPCRVFEGNALEREIVRLDHDNSKPLDRAEFFVALIRETRIALASKGEKTDKAIQIELLCRHWHGYKVFSDLSNEELAAIESQLGYVEQAIDGEDRVMAERRRQRINAIVSQGQDALAKASTGFWQKLKGAAICPGLFGMFLSALHQSEPNWEEGEFSAFSEEEIVRLKRALVGCDLVGPRGTGKDTLIRKLLTAWNKGPNIYLLELETIAREYPIGIEKKNKPAMLSKKVIESLRDNTGSNAIKSLVDSILAGDENTARLVIQELDSLAIAKQFNPIDWQAILKEGERLARESLKG
jgi:ribose 1,5-bisphosphokinase PhnN